MKMSQVVSLMRGPGESNPVMVTDYAHENNDSIS